jgi:hypothetical protein
MKKSITLLFTLLLLSISCGSDNHYHDGKYYAKVEIFGFSFAEINYIISGDDVTINNSLTGISKLKCRQYKDRIEYIEKDGTTKVLPVLENGDIRLNDNVVIEKIK